MTPLSLATKENICSLHHENRARQSGYRLIGGVDEAGRGPLAGPVVAACVILPESPDGLEIINDSKKLKPAKRREAYMLILEQALAIGIGLADAQTIDRVNILQATFLAMQHAVESIDPRPDFLLIDGNRRPKWAQSAETLVEGDALSLSIAAASIIAKVTRDRIMDDYDYLYPLWGFGRHKGYGTADHMEAIQKYGICDLHRRTFSPVTQFALPILNE